MIITLLRKPLEGTIAENTLKHGCGAINIDATRVSTKEESYFKEWDRTQSSAQNHVSFVPSKEVDLGDFKPSGGRWPANFILTHLDGCELRGTKKIKSQSTQGHGETNPYDSERTMNDSSTKDNGRNRWFADEEGQEEVDDWACVEGCPVQELDRQSGRVKGWSSQNHNTFNPYQGNSFHNSSTQRQGYKEGYDDDGGASRFFKQFKKEYS